MDPGILTKSDPGESRIQILSVKKNVFFLIQLFLDFDATLTYMCYKD